MEHVRGAVIEGRMKKLLNMFLCLAVIFSFTACGQPNNLLDDDKPTIVCTGFAQYDWIKNILGEKVKDWNLIRINDKGTDMHSYQPSAEDMILISQCDLLVYTGGNSEHWIEEFVTAPGYEATVYALLNEENGILIEEDHHHEHDGHNHETEEFDEHIWLSPKRAVEFCMEITDLISSIDKSNSDVYEENSSAYIEKLKTLDEAYSDALGGKKENTVIFADRFPFRYMAQDYNFTWHAAFPGCSAETEASFETITHLSEELKESGVSRLFITETGKRDLADSIIAGSGISNIDVVAVNSMQSIGKDERSTYIEIMEENLEKLQVDFK